MNMRSMRANYDPVDAATQAINAGVDIVMLAEEHYDHDERLPGATGRAHRGHPGGRARRAHQRSTPGPGRRPGAGASRQRSQSTDADSRGGRHARRIGRSSWPPHGRPSPSCAARLDLLARSAPDAPLTLVNTTRREAYDDPRLDARHRTQPDRCRLRPLRRGRPPASARGTRGLCRGRARGRRPRTAQGPLVAVTENHPLAGRRLRYSGRDQVLDDAPGRWPPRAGGGAA